MVIDDKINDLKNNIDNISIDERVLELSLDKLSNLNYEGKPLDYIKKIINEPTTRFDFKDNKMTLHYSNFSCRINNDYVVEYMGTYGEIINIGGYDVVFVDRGMDRDTWGVEEVEYRYNNKVIHTAYIDTNNLEGGKIDPNPKGEAYDTILKSIKVSDKYDFSNSKTHFSFISKDKKENIEAILDWLIYLDDFHFQKAKIEEIIIYNDIDNYGEICESSSSIYNSIYLKKTPYQNIVAYDFTYTLNLLRKSLGHKNVLVRLKLDDRNIQIVINKELMINIPNFERVYEEYGMPKIIPEDAMNKLNELRSNMTENK